MPAQKVEVLGLGIDVVSHEEVLAQVERWLAAEQRAYVCLRDVHGVMQSQRDPSLRRIHDDSGLTVPDGMPLVWSARYAGISGAERVYGPDLMLTVCELAQRRGWSSYLYGGGHGTAPLLADRLRERFPGLEIAGTWTPPFRELTPDEDAEVVDAINASGAELVWVGLSTPKQERWMAAHLEHLEAPKVLFGVGAAFDIHAGLKRDAPHWIRPLGLHWVYRLLREPRRLSGRYLRSHPRFMFEILRNPPTALPSHAERR